MTSAWETDRAGGVETVAQVLIGVHVHQQALKHRHCAPGRAGCRLLGHQPGFPSSPPEPGSGKFI